MSGRRNKQKRRNAGAQERRKPKTKHGKQEEKKIEWVSVEEYNSKGQMIMPRRAVQATEGTKYEPNKHTDLKLRICTGMAPQGVIIGQYKLYDIKTFGMGGWRMKADAIIEVGPTRGHEEDWFKAFKGSDVIIESPGLPGAISKQYQMKVSKRAILLILARWRSPRCEFRLEGVLGEFRRVEGGDFPSRKEEKP